VLRMLKGRSTWIPWLCSFAELGVEPRCHDVDDPQYHDPLRHAAGSQYVYNSNATSARC
jgi:hypothetical protein